MADDKTFEGEGNPVEIRIDVPPDQVAVLFEEAKRKMEAFSSAEDYDHRKDVAFGPDGTLKVYLTTAEQESLAAVLDREITSRPSYDGLRQLLSLSHPQTEALLGFLRRIRL